MFSIVNFFKNFFKNFNNNVILFNIKNLSFIVVFNLILGFCFGGFIEHYRCKDLIQENVALHKKLEIAIKGKIGGLDYLENSLNEKEELKKNLETCNKEKNILEGKNGKMEGLKEKAEGEKKGLEFIIDAFDMENRKLKEELKDCRLDLQKVEKRNVFKRVFNFK
jgi:hypothetical protein